METTSIAGKESYLTEGGRGKWAGAGEEEDELHATIPRLVTQLPPEAGAKAAEAGGGKYLWPFVRLLLEAVSLIPKRAPDTRETKKDAEGRGREGEREAPYCRGACYDRKEREVRILFRDSNRFIQNSLRQGKRDEAESSPCLPYYDLAEGAHTLVGAAATVIVGGLPTLD